MKKSKCPASCHCSNGRRDFLKKTALFSAGAMLINPLNIYSDSDYVFPRIRQSGAASTYKPTIKAAFVRRKGDYGMRWPGAVYDGEAARKKYTEGLKEEATRLGINLDIRELPIYSDAEADIWTMESKNAKADGLFVILLDRQEHAWPTAQKAAETGLPVIVFSPLGSSFTTNTINLADKPGCVIFSTDNFNQPLYGLKMLKTGALIKKTKCVVIAGRERKEMTLSPDTGITLQYVPADTFINTYNKMTVSNDVIKMADQYINQAELIKHATRQDVINGIKSYLVAGKILQDEKADAISMDCLGALGDIDVSLPCISWSRMNDDGIPAACEADTGSIASHIFVQYLFDRPGFQQDPVADTSDDTLIGAHCSCPTRLNGFNNPPEPFELIHHHGNRDAVPRTIWKVGQRISCMDFLPDDGKSKMLISTGTVVENLSVPPSGGCVVSVKVKMDSGQEVLSFPGFHQLFFYGDYKRELKAFCQLYNYDAVVV
ncbi:MAG TPA: hypothetical protein VMV47_14670 [Bacteroidales bacterium]|nr:hypothetical protein [Bacteroidales bacterium]